MSQKLIDGNITIEDNASKSLSAIEQALKNIEKIAKPVTKQMGDLNREISKMKNSQIDHGKIYNRTQHNLEYVKGFNSLSDAKKFSVIDDSVKKQYKQMAAQQLLSTKSILADLELKKIAAKSAADDRRMDRLDANVSLRAVNRQASITQQESLRMMRQEELIKHQNYMADQNRRAAMAQIAEREASYKRLAEYKEELRLKAQQARDEKRLAQHEQSLAQQMEKRTDWQKRMDSLAAKGGKLQPLWEAFGKSTSAINLARSPHLVTEGIGGVFGKLGAFGKGVGGFVTGRMIGGMLGSSTLGGIIGGAVAGPVGMAIASLGTLLLSGINKMIDEIKNISSILDEISSERATESTALRRKMQMSSEMFGVDPRNIGDIDKKIYQMRGIEQELYRKGMAGRDITTAAIDWLHLLGTKSSGGVFANEKQAFDFSAALSSIAKMNGLSQQEYETVRYQGMQILSKGYADILDIKPLLNSAPGFVRDILQQTGMTRQELLESGRSRSFTSDKFIEALLGVKDYYEILSERMSSRTAEQQEEAAKNIVGAASVWDELYKKNKAESNQEVANAIIRYGIANDIKESWYQMWSTTNDAADGALNKAIIEKQITNDILKSVMYIYGGVVLIKNAVDMVVDGMLWVLGQIGAAITNIVDFIGQGFLGIFGVLFQKLGEVTGIDTFKEWGETLNPNSDTRKRERAKADLSEQLADRIYEDYQKKGAKYVESKYGYVLNQEALRDVVTGTSKETIMNTYDGGNPFLRGATWTTEKENVYGYSTTSNLMDTLLYGNNAKDKSEERFIDKSKLKEAIENNFDRFVENGAFKTGYSLGEMSGEALVSSAETYRNLADDLGLKHNKIEDYSWMNSLADRPRAVNKMFGRSFSNDIDDMKRALNMIEKTSEDSRSAFEDVKAPYKEKLASLDTKVGDIRKGQSKGTAQILDILKEIAGITVINKVTKVRPDVVFNFGSYGRNGKNEDPNLRAVGDKINSFYNDEENKISINGVTVLNEAG